MINELHPTVLDDLGFCTALEEYADGLEKRAVSNHARHRTARAWRSADQTLLFRIVQKPS
jgi:signal transduction histidine kinase